MASRTLSTGITERLIAHMKLYKDSWHTSTSLAGVMGEPVSSISSVFTRISGNAAKYNLVSRPCSGRGKGVTKEWRYMELAETSVPDSTTVNDVITVERPVQVEAAAKIEEDSPMSALDNFARILGRRMARTMMQAMQEEVESSLAKMTDTLIERWVNETARPLAGEIANKPKLPRVLIAGLLPSQAGMITQEFGKLFDFRFYTTDDSLKHLKTMLNVDHVFTFTSKIEHQTEHMITAAGHKIRRCSGGMTMLRGMLEELYLTQEA